MQKNGINSTVVLLSGGQDSTTALLEAQRKFLRVTTIAFNYGQKHSIELEQAKKIAKHLGVQIKIICLKNIFDIYKTALNSDISVKEIREDGLPKTFVPNRNQLFITVADIFAKSIGFDSITIGVSSVDYSGYPDCRPDFIKAIEKATSLGSGKTVIRTPLMHLNKAETFKLAHNLGKLDLIISHTHTCYEGNRTPNEWGAGCGECSACILRKNGYTEFKRLCL